jgi:cyanophycinase
MATMAIAALLGCPCVFSQDRADHNILKLPAKAVTQQGTLFIVGGGRTPPDVYEEFLRLAGGRKAGLVVIPWAYPHRDKAALEWEYTAWRTRVSSFEILDETVTESSLQALRQATGVWISGGSQSRLVSLYGNTHVETALRGVLERGGVIGGTSAGAAVMSKVMIQHGKTEDPAVGTGFGLIEGAVVDQHFSQRQREKRLLGVLKKHRSLIGLGIDEGTALIVSGNRLRALGLNQITLYLPAASGLARQYLKPSDQAELVTSGEAISLKKTEEHQTVARK